jgi:hypothetical protein
MPDPILHKYFDLGDRALANLTLKSGERVLLTILPAGFAVHRLHVFGIIPGQCIFGINEPGYRQMTTVLARDMQLLPPLPRAKGQHQDDAGAAPRQPDDPPERPLSLLTRLALTAQDADDLARLFERTRNTVG